MPHASLPEREQAICRRLRTWRELRKIRRKDFAEEIELTPNSYGNYEYAKAPLTYGMASKIMHVFGINARWLATGEGPHSVHIPLPWADKLGVSPRQLFSKVYDTHLAAEVERKTAAVEASLGRKNFQTHYLNKGFLDAKDRLYYEERLTAAVKRWILHVPDEELDTFVTLLLHHVKGLMEGYYPDSDEVVASRALELEGARMLLEQRRHDLGIIPE